MQKTELNQSVLIPLEKLRTNNGQIAGLPKNPRVLKDEKFEKLKNSIIENPEMMALRELLVYPMQDGTYVIIGGNMRYRALQDLKYKEAPCKVIPAGTPVENLKAYTIKDNAGFGEWDFDMLANEWDAEKLEDWGVDINFDINGNDENTSEEKPEEETEELEARSLAEDFGVPPFSVLDTKQGYWQERKRKWRSICDAENIGASREGTLIKDYTMRYPTLYTESTAERKKNGWSFKYYVENIATKEQLEKGGGDVYAQGTSLFDPVLAEVIMRWFCPSGGKIIDPFGGEPTKGIVAGVLGYDYSAVEIRKEQVEQNVEACKKYQNVKYYCGDSCKIDEFINDEGFDLCFTSPPYYDLEVYSKEDMSALGTYEEFMQMYEVIFKKCIEKMADNSFLVVKIGEIRDKKTGIYRNFVGDNIAMFKRLGLNYYNEIILVSPAGTVALRAGGQMQRSRKVGHVHQNVLVFHKGDPSKIGEKFKDVLKFNIDENESN